MSVQVENLEKNTAKLTIEVPAEKFEEAVQHSYNKNKGKFNIPGFRKGKAPFNMIKKMYGVGVFYEDAVDEVIDASYPDAAKESGLEIVSRPAVSIEQIEEGKSFIYTAKVAVKPEVTLGEYKGVEVQKTKSEVTEEDIETEIKRAREKNSRLITVEDRGVEDGDQVTITMPKAEVLSCQVDQTSLNEDSYYTTREGLGAEKINADDQTEAIKTAQENMLENVQSDESLLQQAQQRAQELLEQYVKNVGDAMGKTYEVSFVIADEAGTNTVSTDESDN